MGRYVVRRLLQMIPVFFGTTLLLYALMFALPGNALDVLSQGKPKNPAYLAYIADQFHLNDPFFVQYWKYITGIFRGDFGKTFNGTPVLDIFAQRVPVTVTLALTAFTIEMVFGVALGIWTAVRKGKAIDNGSLIVTLLLIATPIFVLGYVVQWLFGVKLQWFPPAGIQEGWPRSYILPGFVLASASFAFVLRLTRSSLLEVFSTDFVRTARAKGLSSSTVMRKYSLRNSLIPVVTFLGADLGALMGGAIITEGIFNIPGIGNQLYRSIHLHESVVVVGLGTVLIIVYLIANLVVDIIYGALDPRIRYE
jgi:peptide/nickel transport system permease protein/oligopeptide transport system permease protein